MFCFLFAYSISRPNLSNSVREVNFPSIIRSFLRLFFGFFRARIRLFVCFSFVSSCIRSVVHFFILPFIRSFVHLLIGWLVHSFFRLFIGSLVRFFFFP